MKVLPVLALMLLGVLGVQAQSIVSQAPAVQTDRTEVQQPDYQQQKLAKVQAQQAASQTTTGKTSKMLNALVAEMKAQQNNPAYDMAGAVKQLQRLAIYPLDHFDPAYPIVERTGNEAIDAARYDQAKQQVKAGQQ
ncbi:MAG: hypothetical protein OHK0039_27590 [Bacteroidia bacterium]